jgi:anti-sigma factor RsiW
MNCSQFRDHYSDFTDGVLDESAEVRFHVHMAECAACRRFDAAFRRGLGALRGLRPPTPSGDFDERLFARLATERPERAPEDRYLVGIAGTVLILAVVGALGWEARTWIAPRGPEAPTVAGRVADDGSSFRVRFAASRPGDTRSRFTVIPVRTDSAHRAERATRSFEVAVDWMVP